MSRDLVISETITLPNGELQWSFVRSSGPGGQNVNKVNSKAVLRWSVRSTRCLPDDVRQRFLATYARRISSDGDMVLTSQRYRDQSRNVADCIEKLRRLVLAVEKAPRRRRKTRPPRAVNERRLSNKRHRARKKELRRRPGME
jgi:ribosome-associated protein